MGIGVTLRPRVAIFCAIQMSNCCCKEVVRVADYPVPVPTSAAHLIPFVVTEG